MSQHVIEGTWEEIKSHEAELIGHHLRVIITPEEQTTPEPSEPVKTEAHTKVLRGHGMLAGILSSEDYFREKREDTIREDRLL